MSGKCICITNLFTSRINVVQKYGQQRTNPDRFQHDNETLLYEMSDFRQIRLISCKQLCKFVHTTNICLEATKICNHPANLFFYQYKFTQRQPSLSDSGQHLPKIWQISHKGSNTSNILHWSRIVTIGWLPPLLKLMPRGAFEPT